ncbi:hypothetical protein LINPERHAP2_LOCUS24302 [Linum perenne]
MVVRLKPLTSYGAGIGKSPSPTLSEKATPLPIYLPTTGTPLTLGFLSIVCTPTRLTKLFGMTMLGFAFLDLLI